MKYIKTISSQKGTFKQLWFLIYQKLIKKRYQNDHNFLLFKIISKYTRPSYISFPSKLHQENTPKQRWIFVYRNQFEKVASKWRRYFDHWSYVKHVVKHGHWSYVKVCQNDVDFWHIEITSNKVRQNNVDFAPIEITSKKYVEMIWKSIDMFFSMYRRNIDIESVSIRLGVPIA